MAREFKDSGIEWIGQIPKEWEVCPHKHIMFKKKEIQEHYVGQDIISLTMNGVVVRNLDAGGKMPLSFDGYQIIYPNNLLLCLFDIDVTPRCVGLINNYGVTSPAYSQFVVKEKGYPPYYDYLLRYMDDHKCLLHLSKNLRSSLTETDFGQIKTCIPPYIEQQKIADYLDKVCGEVDEMVALQETMIEELKAYKQSVITEAVTKGLNPNVSMRNSGIDWIGEIPEGWKLGRIKNLCSIISKGATPPTIDNEAYNGSVRFIKCENISGNKLVNNALYYISSESNNSMKRSQLKENDILFVIAGATIGKTAIVTQDFLPSNTNQAVSFLRLQNKQYTNYLWYILQSQVIQKPLWLNAVQSAQPNLSMEDLGNFDMPIPDESEQRAIASYLDTKCSEIDSLIALKQAKIEELKEYKKSVIYEYVTGKKEVV